MIAFLVGLVLELDATVCVYLVAGGRALAWFWIGQAAQLGVVLAAGAVHKLRAKPDPSTLEQLRKLVRPAPGSTAPPA